MTKGTVVDTMAAALGIDDKPKVAKGGSMKDPNAPASYKQKKFLSVLVRFENEDRAKRGLGALKSPFEVEGLLMGTASGLIDQLADKWQHELSNKS